MYTTPMFVRWTSARPDALAGKGRTYITAPSWSRPSASTAMPRQRHVAYLVGFTESRARTAHGVAPVNFCGRNQRAPRQCWATDYRWDKVEAAVAIKLPKPTRRRRRNAEYGGARETGNGSTR